jgi:hypothetical protein
LVKTGDGFFVESDFSRLRSESESRKKKQDREKTEVERSTLHGCQIPPVRVKALLGLDDVREPKLQ